MFTPDEPVVSQSHCRFRLEQGMDVLDAWSRTASQATRNIVYRVLFTVLDGSVFNRYRTADNYGEPQEFYVYPRDELVIKVRLDDGAFTISYIGPASAG